MYKIPHKKLKINRFKSAVQIWIPLKQIEYIEKSNAQLSDPDHLNSPVFYVGFYTFGRKHCVY
jgi:hypothetical protein